MENDSGVKWIGTANGFTRYDGNDWIVYNMANSVLPTNDVLTLAVDNNNLLWIGTKKYVNLGGGLVSFNFTTNQWNVYKKADTTNPLDSDTISIIAIDNYNNKWIGTHEEGGLYMLTPNGSWTSYKQQPSGLGSNNINDIFIDRENTKWIATPDAGITLLDDQNNFRRIHINNSNLTSNNIKKIKQDNQGLIWAVTDNSIAKLIKVIIEEIVVDEYWVIYNSANTNNILPNTGFTDINFDQHNVAWITTNQGLIRTNEIDWSLITKNTPNHHLASDNLNLIFIEKSNNTKWIGSKDSGISLFRGGNSAFPTGSHIFVYQHPITPNSLKISATVNNFLVNDVEFRINNVVTPATEIATNSWFLDHTVDTSQTVTIRFRFWHATGDSTQDKRVNVSILNNKNPIIELGNEATLSITRDIPNDYWLMTELNDGYFHLPEIKDFLKENLIIFTTPNNTIQKRIILNDGTQYWENIASYIDEYKKYTYINEQGDYRIMNNHDFIANAPINLRNYPNPFNPMTNITFSLSQELNKVLLDVYDIKGRKIKNLYSGYLNSGNHQFYWDGKNEKDQDAVSGIYFVRLSSNGDTFSRKILLLK